MDENARIRDQGDPSDAAFVRITNRQIYESLLHLEKTVDGISLTLAEFFKEDGEYREMKKRVRVLELKVFTFLAAGGTALGAGTLWLLKSLVSSAAGG